MGLSTTKQKIRIILPNKSTSIYHLFALEEAILKSPKSSPENQTFLFHNYQWTKGISIGWKQLVSDIDLAHCKRNGYALTRRITDGWAVVHTPGMIGYSLIGRAAEPGNLGQFSYQTMVFLCETITEALKDLEISAEYDKESRIFVGNKRIAATAALQPLARKTLFADLEKRRISLAHGLLLFDQVDREGHLNALHTPVSDLDNMITIKKLKPKLSRNDVVKAIVGQLNKQCDEIVLSDPTQEELLLADKIEGRYLDETWITDRNYNEKRVGELEGTRGADCFVDTKKGRFRAPTVR